MEHRFNSIVRPVGAISIPQWVGQQAYMAPIDLSDVRLTDSLSRWAPVVEQMIEQAGVQNGEAFLTIDEKWLAPGQTQRRPGAHIDGIWNPALRAHRVPGGHIMPEDNGGGLILLSSVPGCKFYTGEFCTVPGDGGDMEHIREDLDAATSGIMAAGTAYVCNAWGIHESMPVVQGGPRTLVRITLPKTVTIH